MVLTKVAGIKSWRRAILNALYQNKWVGHTMLKQVMLER